jgi:hypothetical protein
LQVAHTAFERLLRGGTGQIQVPSLPDITEILTALDLAIADAHSFGPARDDYFTLTAGRAIVCPVDERWQPGAKSVRPPDGVHEKFASVEEHQGETSKDFAGQRLYDARLAIVEGLAHTIRSIWWRRVAIALPADARYCVNSPIA